MTFSRCASISSSPSSIDITSTMKQLLISGTADIDDGWMGADTYRSLANNTNLIIERFPWIQERVLSSNNQKFPFGDVHVRRTVSWTFDYDGCNNIQEWDAPQTQGLVPKGLYGHDDNLFVYHQNLAAALEELALSKYTPEELSQLIVVQVFNDKTQGVMLFAEESLAA